MINNKSRHLHPIQVRVVVDALHAIFAEGGQADKVIQTALKQNPKAGASDRAFIAETCYEVVRHYRLYHTVLGHAPKHDADWWQMVGIHLVLQGQTLPPWREFEAMDTAAVKQAALRLASDRKVTESVPDWLDELGEMAFGDAEWAKIIHALNQPATVVLRTNTLGIARAELQKLLLEEGVDTKPHGNDALQLKERKNVFATKAFHGGLFEVQDYSSQMVSELLAPKPGEAVVDACAGAGGKSLHLAALMENKGRLIALDTIEWKLTELRHRAKRAKVFNLEARTINTTKVVKKLYGRADALLLDVPCSGLGVLRRNPDAKWKLSPARVEELVELQRTILEEYSPMVKAGGRMVYATCSILPRENQEQVQWFLQSPAGAAFELREEKILLPHRDGFDGFYMALLLKKKE